MNLFVAVLLVLFVAQPCFAWSEPGYHLIASLAFEELTLEEQAFVLTLLKEHPGYHRDFRVPRSVRDKYRWLMGRAAHWPALARATAFDRPNWHWEDTAVLTFGDVQTPVETPHDEVKGATLDSNELHLKQAFLLCRRILRDPHEAPTDRAIALCWVCHLLSDAHQPCNAGSLYMEGLFAAGDELGSNIPIQPSGNLHQVWDGLLGSRFDEVEITQRMVEIRGNHRAWRQAKEAAEHRMCMSPGVWLSHSAYLCEDVYDEEEILPALHEAAKTHQPLQPLVLSEKYLKRSQGQALGQATYAAHRLAQILRQDLSTAHK